MHSSDIFAANFSVLSAQLYSEFRTFFPDNAVAYCVSACCAAETCNQQKKMVRYPLPGASSLIAQGMELG